MNELMVAVERAVRPVHASPARKRRMRQELLAHLTGLVEEERARGGDEPQVLARALQRFGDPADLARELQTSVPLMERRFSALFLRRPGERGLQHALRLAVFVAAITVGEILLFTLVRVAAGAAWSDVWIGLAQMGVVTGYVFLAMLTGYGLYRALAGRLGVAALLRAAACGVAAVLPGVALVVGGSVAQPDNPLWEFILRYPGDLLALSALAFFAGVPLVGGLMAALIVRVDRAREQRACGDWLSC